MKVKYFQDTDTLYIEFRETEAAETRDLDENTLLDIDRREISALSPLSMLRSNEYPTIFFRADRSLTISTRPWPTYS